jgi:hypothetical protein
MVVSISEVPLTVTWIIVFCDYGNCVLLIFLIKTFRSTVTMQIDIPLYCGLYLSYRNFMVLTSCHSGQMYPNHCSWDRQHVPVRPLGRHRITGLLTKKIISSDISCF